MSKSYKVKDLNDTAFVTTRALHYYDEIGILKPSSKTESGHRLYTDDDTLRLQQIISLKYLGFSIKEISSILLSPNFNLKESLKLQLELMTGEAIRLSQMIKLLEKLTHQIDSDSIDWTITASISRLIQMSQINKEKWYENYLSPTELNELKKIQDRYPEEYWQTYSRRWSYLYNEIEANLDTSPEGEAAMKLANKWLNLADEIYPRTSTLRKKLWEAYKSGIYSENSFPHNPELISYITTAIHKFKREQARLA